MPVQNPPATTTMATIEQGMKVFTAIYKRVYRSLTEELYKLFMLNKRYLDPQTETAVLDEPVGPDDFDKDNYDVCPTADPSATSKQEKLAKAQTLMEIGGQLGTLDKIKVTERVLDALEESKDLMSQQEMMHKFDMAKMEMQASKMKMMMEGVKGASEMVHKDMDHKQKMVQSEEQ